MPCSDGGYSKYLRDRALYDKFNAEKQKLKEDKESLLDSIELERTIERSEWQTVVASLQVRNDLLAQVLCGTLSTIEVVAPELLPTLQQNVKGLDDWWEEHKKFDRERMLKEYKEKYPDLTEDTLVKLIQENTLNIK